MTVSTRTRFEILKRDGFKCRYCGAQGFATVLHVDHVVPVAGGGTDDFDNLVTACADCNLGKSSISLDESQISPSSPTDAMREHAAQIREQLDAQRELDEARAQICNYLADQWRVVVGGDPLLTWYNGLRNVLRTHSIETVLVAIDAVGKATSRRRMNKLDETQYFYGVIRKRGMDGL